MTVRRVPQYKNTIIAVALSLTLSVASAQQPDVDRINQLERKLDQSLQVIEQLQKRVQELENGRGQSTPAPDKAPVAAQADRLEAVEQKITSIQENAGKAHQDFGVPIHGFADVGYGRASSGAGSNRANGFTLGTLSFYLTPQFTDRTKALVELALEADSETQSIGTDLERIQLGYSFNDLATVWLGRFHTPYGYWNTAYHHGAQIQSSLLRPKFINFEDKGGFIPAHMVGVLANGLYPLGNGKVVYDAYVGNGSQIVDEKIDPNNARDDNSNKAFGLNVGYRFSGALTGLQAGGHISTQQINAYSSGTLLNRNRVNMLGAYAFYDGHPWEFIGEIYSFRNKDLSGGSGNHNSWAGFAQGGYRLGDSLPYARIEKASLSKDDNYFKSQTSGVSYSRYALGLRYDLNEASVLKFEANRTRQPDQSNADYNEAWFQYAIRF